MQAKNSQKKLQSLAKGWSERHGLRNIPKVYVTKGTDSNCEFGSKKSVMEPTFVTVGLGVNWRITAASLAAFRHELGHLKDFQDLFDTKERGEISRQKFDKIFLAKKHEYACEQRAWEKSGENSAIGNWRKAASLNSYRHGIAIGANKVR